MSGKTLKSLGRLVELRERERDRLMAEVAAKEAVRERYLGNLRRLEGLRDGAGASGTTSPALSLNCAEYKQVVASLAEAHRTDLRLHEAEIALAQQALSAAARRHQVLGQVFERQRQDVLHEQGVRERKRQDEIAVLAWGRGRA